MNKEKRKKLMLYEHQSNCVVSVSHDCNRKYKFLYSVCRFLSFSLTDTHTNSLSKIVKRKLVTFEMFQQTHHSYITQKELE